MIGASAELVFLEEKEVMPGKCRVKIGRESCRKERSASIFGQGDRKRNRSVNFPFIQQSQGGMS